MNVPEYGTRDWDLWAAGAKAEADIRKEGLTRSSLEVIEVAQGLARLDRNADQADLALSVARIFCPQYLKRRYRIKGKKP